MKTINIKIQTLLMAGLFASTAFLAVSCKDKDTSTNNTNKSLVKSKLYDKRWYTQGSTYSHLIKSNGVYEGDGSWKWVNNSDTMEVIGSSGLDPIYWKFYWVTDHEMSCKTVSAPNETLFKDQPW